MPNLKVTVNAELGWSNDLLRGVAAQMEQRLHDHLNVPVKATNVLIVTSVTASQTADVFAEFVFRKTPARDDLFLESLADELAKTLPEGFAGTFAFRAFAQTADTIFARDLELATRQVA